MFMFILHCLDYSNCKDIIQIVRIDFHILNLYTKEHWNVAKIYCNLFYCVYFFSVILLLMKKSTKNNFQDRFNVTFILQKGRDDMC